MGHTKKNCKSKVQVNANLDKGTRAKYSPHKQTNAHTLSDDEDEYGGTQSGECYGLKMCDSDLELMYFVENSNQNCKIIQNCNSNLIHSNSLYDLNNKPVI